MPIIKSAKKRARQTVVATARNAKTKRALRESLKAFHAAIAEGKADKIRSTLSAAHGALDTAVKKNLMHTKKAARKKSQLATAAKPFLKGAVAQKAKAKTATKVTTKTASKPASKRPAAAKKPATKAAPKTAKTKKSA